MNASHALLAAVSLLGASVIAQSAPCFETSLGQNIGAGDDTVSYNFALGFTFPGPGGSYTAIDIGSNGFLWLGTNTAHTADCCSGNESMFLANDPRVAGMWMDLYPPGAVGTGGGVFFNTFPAAPGVPARAVVTWYQVPEYPNLAPVTVQVQLMDTGEMMISHAATNTLSSVGHTPVVGVTQGLGATANHIGFSALGSAGANTGTNPTAYQFYQTPPNYDLNGYTTWYIPNGLGGYVLTNVCGSPPARAFYSTYGVGCVDSPQSFCEFWPASTPRTFDLSNHTITLINAGTSYVVTVAAGAPNWFTPASASLASASTTYRVSTSASWDDAITNPITLPFNFPFPGGSTNTIEIGTNGIVNLAQDNDVNAAYGSYFGTSYWLNKPANFAVCFGDQDCSVNNTWPVPGYGVYYDVDPSNTAVYITWITQEWSPSIGPTQTFQLKLDASGTAEYRYQQINESAAPGNPMLVGWTPGAAIGGLTNPGLRDLSTSGTFLTGDGSQPVTLINSGGAYPVLGTTFGQDVGNLRNNSALGLLALGFTNLGPNGIPLGGVGAPDCTQWTSIASLLAFPILTPPTATVSFGIPNNTALAGLVVNSQAIALTPGINPLGILVSNGGALTLGM